jgi:hypothetical protein
LTPRGKNVAVEAVGKSTSNCQLRAMKALQRFQPWQTIFLRHLLPSRTVQSREVATFPGVRGETGVKALEPEAEAEEGSRVGEDGASAPRIRGNVTRSAIWVEASGSTQSGALSLA